MVQEFTRLQNGTLSVTPVSMYLSMYVCMYVSLLYIKLCIYRGWQASHRKCAISDIAITSARNNIF